jgi:hypothetical protein
MRLHPGLPVLPPLAIGERRLVALLPRFPWRDAEVFELLGDSLLGGGPRDPALNTLATPSVSAAPAR